MTVPFTLVAATYCSPSLASSYCRCSKCGSLVRPHVIWFGEELDSDVLSAVYKALAQCDLCLLVSGTDCDCMRQMQ